MCFSTRHRCSGAHIRSRLVPTSSSIHQRCFRGRTCSQRGPIQSENENRESLVRPWSRRVANVSRSDHTRARTKIIVRCKHRYALTTKNTQAGTQFDHPNIKGQPRLRIKLLPHAFPATAGAKELPGFPGVKRSLDEEQSVI